jgi:parallel beta-helix repeat protein
VADGDGGGAGDGDQVQINQALTAAGGGKVYLAEGTYTVDNSVSIPNNTVLAGAGRGTTIQVNTTDAFDLVINTDTTTGTGITIQDLRLFGAQGSTVDQKGVHLTGVGQTGASRRVGAKLSNLWFEDIYESIVLSSTKLTHIANTSVTGVGVELGIHLDAADNNSITHTDIENASAGVHISSSSNNTISNNVITGGATAIMGGGVSSTNNIINANTISSPSSYGIFFQDLSNTTVTANNISSAGSRALFLQTAHKNLLSANVLSNSGGSTTNNAIFLDAADSNTITGNTITDSSATTTNYAINISNSTSDTNYLADNTLGGGSINDAGTGTIYANQVDASGNLHLQPAGTVELQKNTNVTGTLQATGNITASSGTVTIGTTSVAGNLVISDGSSNTATIKVGALAGNYEYSIPVTTANDTFCMLTLANCTGGAVSAIGALDGGTPSANGASISSNTLYLQSASATNPGLVNTTTQTFAGNKTFTGNLHVSANNSNVNQPIVMVEQSGSGDSSIELKDASGKSFYVGMDASAGSAFKISSSASVQSSTTVGNTAIGGIADTNLTNAIKAKKVTSGAQGGALSSISVHVASVDGAGPGVKVALYSHDSGNNRPGTIIASTTTSQTLTTGWNTVPISATVAASTTYWIAIKSEGASGYSYEFCSGCAGDSAYYSGQSFSNAWPSPAGAPTAPSTDENYSFYMTIAYGSISDTFDGSDLLTMTDTGAVTMQNSTNSSTAFQVLNAAGTGLFAVNTTDSQVRVGNSTADATGVVLVLDTKNTAGDPTGVAGAMYYNSSMSKFRCYENGGGWRNCSASKLRVSGDVASTDATNWADITGLTMSVNSGETYVFACFLTYTTAATTTAIHLSVNGPASPTALDYAIDAATSSTARHHSAQTAYDTVTNPATGGGATRLPVQINGTIIPSASGTLALRLKTEINSSAATVKRGSYCTIQ